MKKIVKVLLLILLGVNSVYALEGKKLFDLSKQEFATKSNGKVLRFKVNDDVMVHTNCKKDYAANAYIAPNKDIEGIFKLELMKPLENWTLLIEYDPFGSKDEPNNIVLKDDSMNTFTFTISNKLIFEQLTTGFKAPWRGGKRKNILKFVGRGNAINLFINNKRMPKQFSENFKGLYSVEMSLNIDRRDTVYLYNLILEK